MAAAGHGAALGRILECAFKVSLEGKAVEDAALFGAPLLLQTLADIGGDGPGIFAVTRHLHRDAGDQQTVAFELGNGSLQIVLREVGQLFVGREFGEGLFVTRRGHEQIEDRAQSPGHVFDAFREQRPVGYPLEDLRAQEVRVLGCKLAALACPVAEEPGEIGLGQAP